MTTNPTIKLSGRSSTSCETGYFLSSPRVLVRNLRSSLEEYHRRELAWNSAVGTDEEETAVQILNEQFLRLLAFPCVSPETLVCKVGAILADAQMTEWLGNDEEAVRVLLSSLLCVNRGGDRRLPAFHEAARAGTSDVDLSEKVEGIISLLWVLLPEDPANPRIIDRHVVAEIVSNALLLLMEVRIGMRELRPAKRQRTGKPQETKEDADETIAIRRGGGQ